MSLYPIDMRGVGLNLGAMALTEVAKPTGGEAFYNTNGLKQAVVKVITIGSNYYTIAYNPPNDNWNGKYRRITIELTPNALADAYKNNPSYILWPPLKLDYREGYLARNSWPRSVTPRKRLTLPSPDAHGAYRDMPDAFRRWLPLGTVAPFQIRFRAQVTPEPTTEKMKRKQKVEPAQFMQAKWLRQRYRVLKVHYSVDAHGMLTPSADGKYIGVMDFAVLIFADDGALVNSRIDTAQLDLTPELYKRAMQGELGFFQNIAVPVNGNYFLRLGVHEWNSNLVGALEVPVENIQLNPESASPRVGK